MPPWHIDPHVGIQSFKDDPSLSDEEIETIVKWVDAGAPRGNPADMPKPREFDDADRWHIGKPDLDRDVADARRCRPRPPTGGAATTSTPGLTEDRYIKAIESKPGKTAVVHHLLDLRRRCRHDRRQQRRRQQRRSAGEFLNEYAVGKNGDLFPEGTGRLLKAGSKIKFNMHYHSIGEEITDQSQLGIVFYPKGVRAEARGHRSSSVSRPSRLDIPGGADQRPQRRLHALQQAGAHHRVPAAHAQPRQAAVPRADLSGQHAEQINCANYDFNWHIVYNYADDVAPIFRRARSCT